MGKELFAEVIQRPGTVCASQGIEFCCSSDGVQVEDIVTNTESVCRKISDREARDVR